MAQVACGFRQGLAVRARSACRGQWTTFRKVIFPALRPAITAGSLQAFARSLGEFGAIVIVSGNIPNKTLTAPGS